MIVRIYDLKGTLYSSLVLPAPTHPRLRFGYRYDLLLILPLSRVVFSMSKLSNSLCAIHQWNPTLPPCLADLVFRGRRTEHGGSRGTLCCFFNSVCHQYNDSTYMPAPTCQMNLVFSIPMTYLPAAVRCLRLLTVGCCCGSRQPHCPRSSTAKKAGH